MSRRTWLVVVGCSLIVFALTTPLARAQQPAPQASEPQTQAEIPEEIQLTRAVIATERQALVTKAMDLTPEEMQRFWPLYREYRVEMGKVGDRLVALITTYADSYDNLTDETADKLLGEYMAIERERGRVRAKYLPRFKKVMPPRKVMRFYQVENKLDIAIMAEMAQEIPLAR
jgi:hypothetical protein